MLCAESKLPLFLKLRDLLSHALQSQASSCGPYSQQSSADQAFAWIPGRELDVTSW